MNNDMNVRLLKAFAGRWVERAETDTKRSMRKLAEYGISFSSGSLKSFFTLSREILNDTHSPYYRLASEFIKRTDKSRITQFGINFGYYGFADEKKKDTPLAVCVDGRDVTDAASLHQHLTEWDAHEAAICFLFCRNAQPPAAMIDRETGLWPKRAFFVFADGEIDLTQEWHKNVMFLLDTDAPDFTQKVKMLNEKKMLVGAYRRFDDGSADEAVSDAYLDRVHAAGVSFLLLLKGPDCSEDCRRRVNDFCYADKRRPKRPLFVAELSGDIAAINADFIS